MQKYSDSDARMPLLTLITISIYIAHLHIFSSSACTMKVNGGQKERKKNNSRSWQRSMPFDRLQHRLR